MIYREALGTSISDAIQIKSSIINKNGENKEKMDHLKMMFGKKGDWSIINQKNLKKGKKKYLIVNILLSNNTTMAVYFDVSRME